MKTIPVYVRLVHENPEIVNSSVSGNYQSQMSFHKTLADWPFTKQIGNYAKYVLDNNLHGIFHVATTDTVNYFSFEKMVCEALRIDLPQFVAETEEAEMSFAILTARKDIPNDLQMTVSDVLSNIKTVGPNQ